ncbi:MAG: bifunctional (p)ppGpp synthetase/guanosine-3',5'-bis(diphosphate) 3'-pyrophosphohydrolase [Bacilli bacterium]|nr:bifunctional (p)ppGpp synthetase/guanosine-3',5'-bis(diphosphate) 3'-pyrophosphohydrolase [Bacilli bacterium]
MITVEKLVKEVERYNEVDIEKVKKAYDFADYLHKGQYRQSGEPYITHPLNVALILAKMNADSDTLCAALLHDTLEDTNATKDDIEYFFNSEVANLVDGVTKISKMNFSSKKEQNLANTRKIITSITNDVRIIIIKLADRLHNMRTLEYKSKFKQKENAIETMEIFVPLAYYIGAYKIKSELEDISLRYLKPDTYRALEYKKIKIEEESSEILEEMLEKIEKILSNKEIPNEILVRTKNIYGIYKKISMGYKYTDIHDLLALKIMVEEVEDCYRVLGYVHSIYHPINSKFKDYICNPKTNMYKSLHTTVFGPEERLVQAQIKTFKMDKIATHGLTAYWDMNKDGARDKMQKDLRSKFQFFKSLTEINEMFRDNQEFITQVKVELLSDKIYVYTSKGDIIELPVGSTPIDFAYKLDEHIGDTMIGAYVNDEIVPVDYKLVSKDRVRIITNELSDGPDEEWVEKAKTSLAKQKILKYWRK